MTFSPIPGKQQCIRAGLFSVLSILLLVPMPLCGQQDPPANADDKDVVFDRAIQLESFDQVWQTIRKTHWEPERVGESWDAARAKFRPQVEAANSLEEVRDSLEAMLKTLEQSHFGIIPADAYKSIEEDDASGGEGTLGMELRYIEEQLVVTRIMPGMPADLAGIKPGWVLEGAAGKTAGEVIEKCRVRAEHSVMRLNTVLGLVTDARTSGQPGDEITLEMLDENDKPQSKTMTFVPAPGQREKLGNLPPFHVNFESRLLDDEIGYVSFNAFIGGPRLAREFAEAIVKYRDQRGLIIDLRGNRGGLVILVAGMCGWLVDDRAPIGTMTMSGGNELKLVLNPRQPQFQRPVAVLIDECSISAAEIMAGGVKDLGIAEVFGGTTAGLALPSVVVKLPNGDGFQYAMAAYHSASGQSLEGEGVVPTHPVALTRQLLASGPDPVLEAAKKWILETAAQK
jgi:carboxyl-terminal processing protease